MMFTSGTSPPSGMNESCIEFTAPQLASVVTVANRAEFGDAEANLLALHVAAGLQCGRVLIDRMQQRICLRLRIVGDGDAGKEQDSHRRKAPPSHASASASCVPA